MIAARSIGLGCLLLSVLAAGAGEAFAQWSQFRGPNGSGVDAAVGYPVAFSPTSNVVWKMPMPYGQSSPVVAGRPGREASPTASASSNRAEGPMARLADPRLRRQRRAAVLHALPHFLHRIGPFRHGVLHLD